MYRLLLINETHAMAAAVDAIDWSSLGITPVRSDNWEAELKRSVPDIVFASMDSDSCVGLLYKLRFSLPNTPLFVAGKRKSFQYVYQCLKNRVCNYLLEPFSTPEVISTLKGIVSELSQKRNGSGLMQRHGKMINTHMKDLFFQKSLMQNQYRDRVEIMDFLGIRESLVSIGMIELDYDRMFQHAFALKDIVEDELLTNPMTGKLALHMVTIIERSVLFATSPVTMEILEDFIAIVRKRFGAYSNISLSASLIESVPLNEINSAYTKLRQNIEYRFYLGGGNTILHGENPSTGGGNIEDYTELYRLIAIAVYSGNLDLMIKYTERCFDTWRDHKHDASMLKFLCLELIAYIIRHTGYKKMPHKSLIHIISDSRDSPNRMYNFTWDAIISMTNENYHSDQSRSLRLVQQIIEFIRENYGKENINLYYIAKNVVFMSEDYIGRQFKKETGVNFNKYLINYRVERAKELLRDIPDIKISRVAKEVGFDKNPQYFTSLFKKVTAKTPTQYKMEFNNGVASQE